MDCLDSTAIGLMLAGVHQLVAIENVDMGFSSCHMIIWKNIQ